MTYVAGESKLYLVLRSGTCGRIHAPEWLAIGGAVVYHAWYACVFSAGIKCRHCDLCFLCYTITISISVLLVILQI